MARRTLVSGWTLELDDAFQRRADGGEVMFYLPPRTVYAKVFTTKQADPEEAIAAMLDSRRGTPVRTFDRLEPGLAGHAYLLPEGEGANRYWGLNTWTASGGSIACVTFYFDKLEDLDWALGAWHTVRHEPRGPGYVN